MLESREQVDPVLLDPIFELSQGDTPLLVSMPHSGTALALGFREKLTPAAKRLPDTDWFVPQLYDFLPTLNVSVLKANYSRYLIDLNRPLNDEPLYSGATTGLFPDRLFDGSAVFIKDKVPTDSDRDMYRRAIWQAYHDQLQAQLERITSLHGYAILLDAHSISARVPMLFDGQLVDLNWGTNQGASCPKTLLDDVVSASLCANYSCVVNGRFKGGYITRVYGQPQKQHYAIQLELSQATYLDDGCDGYVLKPEKVKTIQPCLQAAVTAMLNWQARL